MRQEDVPQDKGMAEGLNEICYAVDDDGRYVLAPSQGWDPKNIANQQAWEDLQKELNLVAQEVHQGKKSPLAYHMAKNLMDVKLLATYMGIASWRVKRHMKPGVFARMKPDMLARYADLLKMTVAELKQGPPDCK